jgi:hypothetical protein
MNDDTASLLFDVVERLQRNIHARDCPAMVALQGQRKLVLSDYDYLRDQATAAEFERRAAAKAREVGATRWVFAVPQIWRITAGEISARAVSNHPLLEDEQEAITWTAYDQQDGVDYGRVAYTRRPNGEPVFAEPQVLTVGVHPGETTPGYRLLRMLEDNGGSADQ